LDGAQDLLRVVETLVRGKKYLYDQGEDEDKDGKELREFRRSKDSR